MTCLLKDDSWSLFCTHAFGLSLNVPCELKALVHYMVEECDGLPLALKVIGGAMFGRTSTKLEWEPLLKKLRESRVQEKNVGQKLYECSKLGYDILNEDDQCPKDCFLYFIAFLENYIFTFEKVL